MESIAVWVAELVGFALMLFVLWRYVLPLVTRMVNKRQDEIQRQVDEANEASRKLEEAHGRFDNAVQQAEAEAARIRDDARADATRIREELTAQAEADVERMLPARAGPARGPARPGRARAALRARRRLVGAGRAHRPQGAVRRQRPQRHRRQLPFRDREPAVAAGPPGGGRGRGLADGVRTAVRQPRVALRGHGSARRPRRRHRGVRSQPPRRRPVRGARPARTRARAAPRARRPGRRPPRRAPGWPTGCCRARSGVRRWTSSRIS